MDHKVPRDRPRGNEPNRPSDQLYAGEHSFAFRAFAQAAACKSSTALSLTATFNHVVAAILATGGTRADVFAALDAAYCDLATILDGALVAAVAELSEHVE